MIITNDFEEQYLALRRKERRLYTDEEVKLLPEINPSHPHYMEWLVRKSSGQKLVDYLATKKKKLDILDVGCGNGWLSAKLSKIRNSTVTGVDINKAELNQAKRVFDNIKNLNFFLDEIINVNIHNEKFDVIIFAASIQYFASLDDILPAALELLAPAGEIHILDSHFYKSSELLAARQRSAAYFLSAGFPEMNAYYFHLCLDELKKYRCKTLYDPHSVLNFFTKNKNPFPWFCIYQHV
jgi:2-polyprenyl-3-methyl-5-hydroxy-6-metoxy-1,4-benzoquinol methylase